ncbi:MAG: hypothetical protein DWQ10_15005 [Calditrichaeota bacterium]|nr:MAG: hypothetical protein DWQ10_15005 [Calditrichota bacterium]
MEFSREYFFCIFLLFLCCGNDYMPIDPGISHRMSINYADQNNQPQQAVALYSVPENYTPVNAYPLIIALHGYGSNAAAFHDLWRRVANRNKCILLTPQGTEPLQNDFGFEWGENAAEYIKLCYAAILDKIHIDTKSIYVVGFSAGGRLSYQLGLNSPTVFQGLAALGAPFEKSLINRNIRNFKTIGAYDDFRVYIGTGEEDALVEQAVQANEAIRQLGAKVHFEKYENIGHSIPEPKKDELLKILDFLLDTAAD